MRPDSLRSARLCTGTARDDNDDDTFTSYDFDYHNLHVVLFVNAFYVRIASRMLRYTALFRYIERALDLRLRRRLWDLLLRRRRLRSATTRRR